MKIKKAVIVAAGLSSRLYPLTLEKPKGLLQIKGEALLERSIKLLKKNNISDIAIVVGYKKEMIIEAFGDEITYILNPFYAHCNNMGSLWFAKNFVQNSPFVYLHGDIIYDERILFDTLNHFKKNKNDIELVTHFGNVDEESMKVCTDKNNFLIESNKEIPLEKANGEWIGIAYIKSSREMFEYFEKVMFNEGLNFYDTHAFTKMAKANFKIFCSSTNNFNWIEIDFKKDLKRAKELFK